jgi:hypothetical protein
VLLDNLDFISFWIADLKMLNTLPVPLDCPHADPARHHDVSHLADLLGEQHRRLARPKIGPGRKYNWLPIFLKSERGRAGFSQIALAKFTQP